LKTLSHLGNFIQKSRPSVLIEQNLGIDLFSGFAFVPLLLPMLKVFKVNSFLFLPSFWLYHRLRQQQAFAPWSFVELLVPNEKRK
jgi:hypothetical protein